MDSDKQIEVIGARVNNLKNVDVTIPRDKLTVITGLSGSGKSSLAFDTIFAEGQRRYIDTFSSYARGYIGTMERPDVDKITGLSPVISIDQKTTQKNPRSTVGTITEIYDYLRLLFARAGEAYSYLSGEKMVHYTDQQIVEMIAKEYAGKKIYLLAPLVNNRKGHYKELFDTVRKKGFLQVRVDGEIKDLVFGMKVDRYSNHNIELVVDKLRVTQEGEEDTRRLRQSVDKAMTQGNGVMMIVEQAAADGQQDAVRFLSRNLMCPVTGLSYPEPAPHSFSFNSPSGWCPTCHGLGKVLTRKTEKQAAEVDEIIRDEDNWFARLVDYPVQEELEEEATNSEWSVCPDCGGKRLNKEALSYRFAGKTIAELSDMDIDELLEFLERGKWKEESSEKVRAVAEPILKEICARLRFMQSVGLTYLSLSRSSESLSGGESQRIRLATQIGSRLVNVLYILDEPSIGLHQRDNQRLIRSLKELRDMGNSVIVVEHDEQIMREADYIVDIGPKAGRLGGKIMFQGTPEQMLQSDCLTAKWLRGEKKIPEYRNTELSEHQLQLFGCRGNNLKNIDVAFPLGKMIGVDTLSYSLSTFLPQSDEAFGLRPH